MKKGFFAFADTKHSLGIRFLTFWIYFVLYLFAFNRSAYSDEIDNAVQKARTAQGTIVIKCSPGGTVEGTVSLEDGLKNLKSGMSLYLFPENYNPKELVILEQDNIIIEGDGSGSECYLPLIVYGKDCIVRNIHLRSLEAGDITVVDSKIWRLLITNGGKRVKAVIFNSCMRGLSIYADKSEIMLRESTILNSREPTETANAEQAWRYGTSIHHDFYYNMVSFGNIATKGEVFFEKCIIYSGSGIFGTCVKGKSLELTLEENLIFFKKALISTGKDKMFVALKELGDFFKVRLKGNNILKEPVFKKALDTKSYWQLYTNNLTLTDTSPGYGKGLGANMGAKDMPVKRTVDKDKKKI
ncbi:MAG: hypothetical protein A2017_03735 [Lentisphaerae bacterium GWF2_44_16]|nr:MAG: hypothetical protein A2017_03735 [Lentisphaerae bacterium GWF2_44_16]